MCLQDSSVGRKVSVACLDGGPREGSGSTPGWGWERRRLVTSWRHVASSSVLIGFALLPPAGVDIEEAGSVLERPPNFVETCCGMPSL